MPPPSSSWCSYYYYHCAVLDTTVRTLVLDDWLLLLELLRWSGVLWHHSSLASFSNVYVWTCQMMENKLKMRWSVCVYARVCVRVCTVNLFRLFSLLETHANEIEWKRMTSIQTQTDSLISTAVLLTTLLFFFFTPLIFFFSNFPVYNTNRNTHTHTCFQTVIQEQSAMHAPVL